MSKLPTPEQLAASGTEEAHQIALFAWAALNKERLPELDVLFHVPNGGSRSKIEGSKFKSAGVKAGVPDLALPVPRQSFPALFIEMKAPAVRETKNGGLSDAQLKWVARLRELGNCVAICYGWEEAKACLEWYLEG